MLQLLELVGNGSLGNAGGVELGECLGRGLLLHDLLLELVELRECGLGGGGADARGDVGGSFGHLRAGDENVLAGAGLIELHLQGLNLVLQLIDLGGNAIVACLQLFDLALETNLDVKRLAGKGLVAVLQRELGLVVPVGNLRLGIGELLSGNLLATHGLTKGAGGLIHLVFHLQNELLHHLHRIFRLINHVVDVCLQDVGDAFEECHDGPFH